MTKKFFLGIFLFVAFQTFAQQEDKWSLEANYSIVPSNGFFGNDNVIDVGIKHRFVENKLLTAGLSLNTTYFVGNENFVIPDSNDNFFIFQPRVFSEFKLPFSKRLRPTLGLGYSFFAGTSVPVNGFNFNTGLIYDISDKLYVQLHYDFISLQSISSSEGYNNFRLGVGFKF